MSLAQFPEGTSNICGLFQCVHKPYAWKTFPDHKLLLLIWSISALARNRPEQQNFVSKYSLISFGQNNKYMSHFIASLNFFHRSSPHQLWPENGQDQQNFVIRYSSISFGQNDKYQSHLIEIMSLYTSFIELVHISFGQKWTRTTKFCGHVFINQLWPEWQTQTTLYLFRDIW